MPALTQLQADSKTSTAASGHQPVRIIADDLTGACDSAVSFLHAGCTARVWLGAIATEPAIETVQAFNTASRDSSPAHAAKTVSEAAVAVSRNHQTLFFKKIDSAGRGHLVPEVLAAHRALGAAVTLFAPGFPAAGRTVRQGVLYVEDASGARSCLPLIPLFQEVTSTAQISRPDQIPGAIAAGATILICDSSTQADLEALAAFEHPDLLYAGSAGLARAVAARHAGALHSPAPPPRVAQMLTICGTRHMVTRLQLQHLLNSHPDHPLLQIRAKCSDAAAILAAFHQRAPEALILTGGDTAMLVLTTLGAHSIILRGELAPGIPWGEIQGGIAHSRIVITKSGGFGSIDALTNIVKGFA